MYKADTYKISLCISIVLLLICSICVKNLHSDESVLDLKVGACDCYTDCAGPYAKCFVPSTWCESYQRWQSNPFGPPARDGCEPGAYFHGGCDADNDYFVYGSATDVGYDSTTELCSDYYAMGDCEENSSGYCVEEQGGNVFRCSGCYEDLWCCWYE